MATSSDDARAATLWRRLMWGCQQFPLPPLGVLKDPESTRNTLLTSEAAIVAEVAALVIPTDSPSRASADALLEKLATGPATTWTTLSIAEQTVILDALAAASAPADLREINRG
jgi:hypothetical protein